MVSIQVVFKAGFTVLSIPVELCLTLAHCVSKLHNQLDIIQVGCQEEKGEA